MNEQGARRVELVGLSDKRQITAVFCGNLLGAFLPIQLIYERKPTGAIRPSIFHQAGTLPMLLSIGPMKRP